MNSGTSWNPSSLFQSSTVEQDGHASILIVKLLMAFSTFYALVAPLEEAQELLGGTAMTIKCVAASVGIDDVRYFHRAFLRETGVSPGQWRKERISQSPKP